MDEQEACKQPRHIAIIMDGNGRWANQQGLPRIKGHEQGADTVESIVTYCAEQGIGHLSLYAFSLDNWKRPKPEVAYLMRLLKRFLKSKEKLFTQYNITFNAIGSLDLLSRDVLKQVRHLEDVTATHTGMTLHLALSYSGRMEITDAARNLCAAAVAGSLVPEDITPELFGSYLYTGTAPDPDILIRTGGDQRVSDFLLWQISYAELFFPKTLWPDFAVSELEAIIAEFNTRERRFGKVLS